MMRAQPDLHNQFNRYNEICYSLANAGNFKKALSYLQSAPKTTERRVIFAELCHALFKAGLAEQAISLYELIPFGSQQSFVLTTIFCGLAEAGRFREAILIMKKSSYLVEKARCIERMNSFNDNPSIALLALERDPAEFEYISYRLSIDEEFLIQAASKNGLVLHYIAEHRRTERVTYAALTQNPEARTSICSALVATARAEIDEKPNLFLFIPPDELIGYEPVRRDTILLNAVKRDPLLLQFVPFEIQITEKGAEIIQAALESNPETLKFVNPPYLIKDWVLRSLIDNHNTPDRRASLNTAFANLASRIMNQTFGSGWDDVDRSIVLVDYLKENKPFIIFAIHNFGIDPTAVAKDLWSDFDVMKAIISKSPYEILNAPDPLKQEPILKQLALDIFKDMVKKDPSLIGSRNIPEGFLDFIRFFSAE